MKKYIRIRIYKNIQLYPYIHLCMIEKRYTYVYEHIEISDVVRLFRQRNRRTFILCHLWSVQIVPGDNINSVMPKLLAYFLHGLTVINVTFSVIPHKIFFFFCE